MIDRSDDPYYQGWFWCYEAQQYFRWNEMKEWYEEQRRLAAKDDTLITGA